LGVGSFVVSMQTAARWFQIFLVFACTDSRGDRIRQRP